MIEELRMKLQPTYLYVGRSSNRKHVNDVHVELLIIYWEKQEMALLFSKGFSCGFYPETLSTDKIAYLIPFSANYLDIFTKDPFKDFRCGIKSYFPDLQHRCKGTAIER